MTFSLLTSLGLGTAIALVAFAIVWAVSVRVHNYGFLDVAWSYGVLVLAPLYAVLAPGTNPQKWFVTAVGALWSLRLGTYILRRVLRHHPQEDVRYRTLRERWPTPGKFLLFFELQALLVAVFSLPFLFISFDPSLGGHPLTLAGAALALLSLAGEALSDWQMARFKADPAHRGRICQAGLWRYSRHPNYFFESMVWVGFFLAALPSPHGWWALACPLLMLYFLFQVTGIPLTEQHALESKGESYREYQRTTSAFVPWFHKS